MYCILSLSLSLSLSLRDRAIHRSGTECLRLLLKPDMTYFKDHRGRTVIHQAAKEGAMAAAEIILKMRPDAIFDTDKLVSSNMYMYMYIVHVQVSAWGV